MKKLDKDYLLSIKGGINITAALINAIARIGGTILELGRTVGTSIVRLRSGKICKM